MRPRESESSGIGSSLKRPRSERADANALPHPLREDDTMLGESTERCGVASRKTASGDGTWPQQAAQSEPELGPTTLKQRVAQVETELYRLRQDDQGEVQALRARCAELERVVATSRLAHARCVNL